MILGSFSVLYIMNIWSPVAGFLSWESLGYIAVDEITIKLHLIGKSHLIYQFIEINMVYMRLMGFLC